jgi:gliding motility-associated lipoprotein GldH
MALKKILIIPCLFLLSCQSIDLYEKVVPIPGHAWKTNFKPAFHFTIKDTTSAYQLYVILRHTEKYNYNNIWINIHIKTPEGATQTILQELPLANNEGWLGEGIDDIYEHRIKLSTEEMKFTRSGTYTFSLQHVMRQNPLEYVMNAGIRIEKK